MDEEKKVYAICENKCLKETMTKEQISGTFFGITSLKKITQYFANEFGFVPESGTRLIYSAGIGKLHLSRGDAELGSNYYSEIIIQKSGASSAVKPSDFITGDNITIKWLNDDLNISDYNVIHYHFTYDGINLCCRCSGYA